MMTPREYVKDCRKRYERVKSVTGDCDFAFLQEDNKNVDFMEDAALVKEYKRWKKANPEGLDKEEL